MTQENPQPQTIRDYMHECPLPLWNVISGGRYIYIPHQPCNFRMIASNIDPNGNIIPNCPIRIFFHTKSTAQDGREYQDYLDLDPGVTVSEVFDGIVDLARTVAFNEMMLEVKHRRALLEQQQGQAIPAPSTAEVADAAADLPAIPQQVPVQDWDAAENEETGDPELAAAAQSLIDEVGEDEEASTVLATDGAMVVAPPSVKRTRNRRH